MARLPNNHHLIQHTSTTLAAMVASSFTLEADCFKCDPIGGEPSALPDAEDEPEPPHGAGERDRLATLLKRFAALAPTPTASYSYD